MRFGIYVHIPHCLQQCPYCDFATVKFDHPVTYKDYTEIVLQEIRTRNEWVPYKKVSTLYFGGGTPSLVGPQNIAAVAQELSRSFDLTGVEEVTLEINPGTITEKDLEQYLKIGVTRFSVGAQTFSPSILSSLGRTHSVESTLETIRLLKRSNVLYTMDLLFALPHQSMNDLNNDLKIISDLQPSHVSAYCLTVPDKNPMSKNRSSDETQVEMYYRIHDVLKSLGLNQYEVSSYSLPGKESQHNSLYWQDLPYWGIGMSAHSFFKNSDFGTRFWNPPTIAAYQRQVTDFEGSDFLNSFPKEQIERLSVCQALTDFCHTQLRTRKGLNTDLLTQKFGAAISGRVGLSLDRLQKRELVERCDNVTWAISHKALVLSEQVFQEMTFIASDL